MSRPRTDAGRHRFLDSARRRGGRSATDQAVASSAPHFTRYVIDGVDAAAPAGATVADALMFAEASTERCSSKTSCMPGSGRSSSGTARCSSW